MASWHRDELHDFMDKLQRRHENMGNAGWIWFLELVNDGGAIAKCPMCMGPLEIRFKDERPQGGSLLVCEQCSIALAF
jgi:hypothetical protein